MYIDTCECMCMCVWVQLRSCLLVVSSLSLQSAVPRLHYCRTTHVIVCLQMLGRSNLPHCGCVCGALLCIVCCSCHALVRLDSSYCYCFVCFVLIAYTKSPSLVLSSSSSSYLPLPLHEDSRWSWSNSSSNSGSSSPLLLPCEPLPHLLLAGL